MSCFLSLVRCLVLICSGLSPARKPLISPFSKLGLPATQLNSSPVCQWDHTLLSLSLLQRSLLFSSSRSLTFIVCLKRRSHASPKISFHMSPSLTLSHVDLTCFENINVASVSHHLTSNHVRYSERRACLRMSHVSPKDRSSSHNLKLSSRSCIP